MARELRKAKRALAESISGDRESCKGRLYVFWYDEPCAIDPQQLINYGDVGVDFQALVEIPVAARAVRMLDSSDQALLDALWTSASLDVLRTRPVATRETQLVPLVHPLVTHDPFLT